MKDSIDIIIGCYKQEKWLDEAIWSAQNQILPLRDVYSPNVLPQLLTKYSIKVVHDNCEGKGTGASASRNRAIAKSTADWIFWLDADDMLPSHFIFKMLDAIQSSFVDVTKTIYRAPVQFIEGARLDLLNHCPIIESDDLAHHAMKYPMCMSAMFPRQAWIDVLGFDASLYNMNDLDFWVRCGYAGYKFVGVNTFMLRRNVPGSLIDLGASREEEILAQFNTKHGTRLTKKLLPYRVPMRDEC